MITYQMVRKCKSITVRGFTLIEIMVVVIIISIVTAVALLSVDVTGHQKARTFAKELQFMMRHISNESVLTGNPYALEFDRKAQKLTPLVYISGAWRRATEIELLDWDPPMTIKMVADGIDLEEQEESDENTKRILPKISFWTNGLWEPAGGMELLIEGLPYLNIVWTSSGKMEAKLPQENEGY